MAAPNKLVTFITKTAALAGLAAAGLMAASAVGVIGAGFPAGALLGGVLSSVALAGVSWAGFRSAQATSGLRTHDFSKNVSKGTSTLAKLGGIGFMILGVATMLGAMGGVAPAAMAGLALSEVMGLGALSGIVGYGIFQSGLGADYARNAAQHAPPPAPAQQPARSKGVSIGASVNLGQTADIASEEQRAPKEAQGRFSQAVLDERAELATLEQRR